VNDWAQGVTADLYINAMDGGEVFFIALEAIDGANIVLGFASDYVREGSQHGTSVYVRGMAARRGIGSALFKMAEAEAISKGATSFHVEASFAGVGFYRANGFIEIARGEVHLANGQPIGCVFMEKSLA
jgi:GNAT superfamily N-acetyltransferase